jgi:hypothetical protein
MNGAGANKVNANGSKWGELWSVKARCDVHLSTSIFALMKKCLFLGACLVALASEPVLAQTGGAELVVVHVQESSRSLYFSIARGQQQPEEIEIKLTKEVKAAPSYYTVLSKFYAQGYVVQAVIPGLNSSYNWTESTLIHGKSTSKP